MTYGTVVGHAPIVPGGFTDHHAVGGTVNTLDNIDLYEITLAEGGYFWDGQVRPFESESHSIKVRQADGTLKNETFQSKWSVHGPLVAEKSGKGIAVRIADLEQPFQYEQYWQMARARSFAEFEAAVKRLQSNKSNMSYADRDGHIYYFTGARIPRRANGDVAYWAGVVPGDNSRTLWTDVLRYDELPHFVDPPSGWIQNANDPPWYSTFPQVLKAEDFPPWMSPIGMGFRPQRSVRMITSKPQLTLEDVETLKLSTRVEFADRILDDLVPAARAQGGELARDGADVLEAWDRMTEPASRGAVLFEAWVRAMRESYAPAAEKMFATPWDPDRPLDTPDGLADPQRATAALEAAAQKVRDTWGSLDVAWGDIHRFRCAGNDWPANGGPGDLGIFRTIGYSPAPDGKLSGMTGDSFVAIIELGKDVRARVLMSYGNASQANQPFKCDQMELLARKEMRWAWTKKEDIEANLLRREEL
jgi:acyl-homoserine-lactone acylase